MVNELYNIIFNTDLMKDLMFFILRYNGKKKKGKYYEISTLGLISNSFELTDRRLIDIALHKQNIELEYKGNFKLLCLT